MERRGKNLTVLHLGRCLKDERAWYQDQPHMQKKVKLHSSEGPEWRANCTGGIRTDRQGRKGLLGDSLNSVCGFSVRTFSMSLAPL